MGKIESVTGWLHSVNTDKATLDIQVNSGGIAVVSFDWGSTQQPNPNRPRTLTYPYKTALFEDTNLGSLVGQRVRCTLEDGIVAKAEPV